MEAQGADTIIMKGDGSPYQTQAAAMSGITKSGLDPAMFQPVDVPGGWGIRKKDCEAPAPTPRHKKFFLVRFHAKSNPTDTNDVQLFLNGKSLVIGREREAVVSGAYLEVADNARYPKYEQKPGKPRKTTAWVQTFPYSVIREAAKDEFEAMKSSGNKATRQHIARYGFDAESDEEI